MTLEEMTANQNGAEQALYWSAGLIILIAAAALAAPLIEAALGLDATRVDL